MYEKLHMCSVQRRTTGDLRSSCHSRFFCGKNIFGYKLLLPIHTGVDESSTWLVWQSNRFYNTFRRFHCIWTTRNQVIGVGIGHEQNKGENFKHLLFRTSNIQAIQQKVDESAKGLTTKNAEYQKRKQELEVNSGHKRVFWQCRENYSRLIRNWHCKQWRRYTRRKLANWRFVFEVWIQLISVNFRPKIGKEMQILPKKWPVWRMN
jgi:hypothetical protein